MSGGEMTQSGGFFGEISKDLDDLTPEQQKEMQAFQDKGMAEETAGLPIVYPKIEMLHQETQQFRFVNTEDVVKTFRGIILYVERGRAWWPEAYGKGDDGGSKIPKCYSRDLIAPDPRAEQKQADTCGPCPMNQWGSEVREDGKEGRGKSCKELRRVFIMPENHLSPHFMPVPPSSLKPLRVYLSMLTDKNIKRPQLVATTFKLVQKANQEKVKYSELALELGGAIDPKVAYMAVKLHDSIEEVLKSSAPMTREDYEGGAKKPAETT